MITRGKAALAQMPALGGLLTEKPNKSDPVGNKVLTGQAWSKRKSRSKIAKESKKRNR